MPNPVHHDERRYKDRWRVEAMFCRFEDFQPIATRDDQRARNFPSAVHLAAAIADCRRRAQADRAAKGRRHSA